MIPTRPDGPTDYTEPTAARALVDRLCASMIAYNGADPRRVNHALKVFAYADHIAAAEGCDAGLRATIACAALLHDIGIHNAEARHGSSAGNWQEMEGPPVAAELLGAALAPAPLADRVCYLVGHHHTYNKIDGPDFQILVEADFIVNVFEDGMDKAAVTAVRKTVFRTAAGRALLDSLYP